MVRVKPREKEVIDKLTKCLKRDLNETGGINKLHLKFNGLVFRLFKMSESFNGFTH